LINNTGIKTAHVKSLITINGRQGIVFEKLAGITMANLIKTKPWRIIHYAKKFAEVHADIYQCLCPGLPEQKTALKQFIYLKNLTKDEENELLNKLDEMPDGDYVCHNDFNLDNVILCQDGYYTLDWFCATNGHPAMDIAHTYINLKQMIKGLGYSPLQLLKRLYLDLFSIIYLIHSISLSGFSRQQIKMWERFLLSIGIDKWIEPLDTDNIIGLREL